MFLDNFDEITHGDNANIGLTWRLPQGTWSYPTLHHGEKTLLEGKHGVQDHQLRGRGQEIVDFITFEKVQNIIINVWHMTGRTFEGLNYWLTPESFWTKLPQRMSVKWEVMIHNNCPNCCFPMRGFCCNCNCISSIRGERVDLRLFYRACIGNCID